MKLLDNSCLSLFVYEVPQYDFIRQLFDINESLNITTHVRKEFEKKDDSNRLDEYISDGMIHVEDIDYDDKLEKRYPMLGKGELSIIQWGLILKGKFSYKCILDDLHARRVALRLGLSISGSIGLIKLLKEKNHYSNDVINEIITDINESNFRISGKILDRLWD